MSDDDYTPGQRALLDTLSELRRERDSLRVFVKKQGARLAELDRETKMVDAAWAFVRIDIRRREADRRFREAKAEIRSEYPDGIFGEVWREYYQRTHECDAAIHRKEIVREWITKLNAMRRAADKAGVE